MEVTLASRMLQNIADAKLLICEVLRSPVHNSVLINHLFIGKNQTRYYVKRAKQILTHCMYDLIFFIKAKLHRSNIITISKELRQAM